MNLKTIIPALLLLALLSGCNKKASVTPEQKTNTVSYVTNINVSGFTSYELAIIAGASNGTYASMLHWNKEHGITNPPPALEFNGRNPIGSFVDQYAAYL